MVAISDILPGYLKVPIPKDSDFDTYLAYVYSKTGEALSGSSLSTGRQSEISVFVPWTMILPSISGGRLIAPFPTKIRDEMFEGKVQGIFAFGMNGVATLWYKKVPNGRAVK